MEWNVKFWSLSQPSKCGVSLLSTVYWLTKDLHLRGLVTFIIFSIKRTLLINQCCLSEMFLIIRIHIRLFRNISDPDLDLDPNPFSDPAYPPTFFMKLLPDISFGECRRKCFI
jgi:hypothetical protein